MSEETPTEPGQSTEEEVETDEEKTEETKTEETVEETPTNG